MTHGHPDLPGQRCTVGIMIITGRTAAGNAVFEEELPHGVSPVALAGSLGWAVERPRSADLVDGEVTLDLAVVPLDGGRPPEDLPTGRDPGLGTVDGQAPRRQRVAAYALVTSTSGLLATEFSDRTAVPGRWGLPGGGIDPGETPRESVLREVVEETNQTIELGDLVEVQSSHWVGRAPTGIVQDFHALRLVYTATCPAPRTPEVLDVGGTTEQSRWIPLAQWDSVPWTSGWQDILGRFLPHPQSHRGPRVDDV